MRSNSRVRQRTFARWRKSVGLICLLSISGPTTGMAAEQAGRPSNAVRAVPMAVGADAASAQQALYLIRSTLLSLDDANRSGNYTVLRDLAAPSFQKAHSAADLAVIFSELRRSGIALTLIAITQPRLVAEPVIDTASVLHLNGVLPTAHLQFAFDMRFQSIDGAWRLAALSVGAQPPAASPSPAVAKEPAKAVPEARAARR